MREPTDTEMLDWLEKRGTVEIELYHGWTEIDGEWEGATLRDAIAAAMLAAREEADDAE